MKLGHVAWGAAVIAAMAAGCGGGSPSCEEAIKKANRHIEASEGMVVAAIDQCKDEKWSDALRSCLASAGSAQAANTCMRKSAGDRPVAKKSEAELKLDHLRKAAKSYFAETAAFPSGKAAPTPSDSCCDGPNHKCPPSAAPWMEGVWSDLDFFVDEPSFFQYAYEGRDDGQGFTARAIGDLDCDLNTIEYVLEGRVENGNPVFTLTKPANRD